jgi:hypothetical protein
LDYFGGMMFKNYWDRQGGAGGFPRDWWDYIFVRNALRGKTSNFKLQISGKPQIPNYKRGNVFVASGAFQPWARFLRGFALASVVILASGCHLVKLAPVNLQEGGWKLQEGQAIWKRNKEAPEIAGDVLVATRGDRCTFVQFTKTPFPMIIAQTTTNRWQIEIPMQNKRYSGPGSPPKRLIWAYLPRLLAGEAPPKGWSWNRLPDNGWRLENAQSGEMLQGYVSPSTK